MKILTWRNHCRIHDSIKDFLLNKTNGSIPSSNKILELGLCSTLKQAHGIRYVWEQRDMDQAIEHMIFLHYYERNLVLEDRHGALQKLTGWNYKDIKSSWKRIFK